MQLLQLVTFIECELGMVEKMLPFFSRRSMKLEERRLGIRSVCAEWGWRREKRNILLKYVNLQWNETRGVALALTWLRCTFGAHNNVRTDCISLCLIVRKDSIKVNSKLGERDPWGLAECLCEIQLVFWLHHVSHAQKAVQWALNS